MKKRWLAILLTAALAATMVPVTAWGDELPADAPGEEALIEEAAPDEEAAETADEADEIEADDGAEVIDTGELPEEEAPAGVYDWAGEFPAAEDFAPVDEGGEVLDEADEAAPVNGAGGDISKATITGVKSVYRVELVGEPRSDSQTLPIGPSGGLYGFKYLMDGKEISPISPISPYMNLDITVKLGGTTLKKGKDYEIVGNSSGSNPMAMSFIVRGIGEYTGEKAYTRPVAQAYSLAGKNRYATNAMLIDIHGELDFSRIVVVTGEKFPDALAANAYAGIRYSPLVLTKPDKLHKATRELLEAYKNSINEVVLIGGDLKGAEAEMKQLLPDASFRTIAGKNRYRTADAVTKAFIEETYGDGEVTGPVFVATGQSPADALSASTWSYSMHIPVLLVKNGKADAATQKILNRFKEVYLLGGTNVVANSNVPSGAKKTRLGGSNRWETSRKIADHFVEKLYKSSHFEGYMTLYCPGDDALFPDALGAGQFNPISYSAVVLVKKTKAPVYRDKVTTDEEAAYMRMYSMCVGSAGKDAGSGSEKGKIYEALMKNIEKKAIANFGFG